MLVTTTPVFVIQKTCIPHESEPFRLGLAQGRLQAEASSLEISVPVIPISRLPPAIGCCERVRGLRGLGGESRES